MSLNIWLVGEEEEILVEKNIQYNLESIWREAGVYSALYHSEGMLSKEVVPDLTDGLEKLREIPHRFIRMTLPIQGASYSYIESWLEDLIEQFKCYPEGKIEVSYIKIKKSM